MLRRFPLGRLALGRLALGRLALGRLALGRLALRRILRRLAGTAIASPVPLPEGVVLVRGGWIPGIGGLFTGSRRAAAAVTLGDTIIVHPSAVVSRALVRHELEHVRQWREDGWLFPFRYTIEYARHGYSANPYEVAARNAEQETS